MHYKPDWPMAKKRLEAFWHNEIVDRCCMAVFAPRKTSKLPPFPELQYGPWLGGLEKYGEDDTESVTRWWTDPEQNYARMITWFENTYFGGEAIPATYVNWGAMAMAAFYGSPPMFEKTTVWYPPVIEDWGQWRWEPDLASNRWWQQIFAITRHLIQECQGRYFVGTPEVGGAGDVLSLMRGPDRLSMDLIENPEAVKAGIRVIADTWVKFHEEMFLLTREVNQNGDILPWLSLWAPGRHDQVASDFSTMLSPGMFREFFIPEIVQECAWCEYATYHLDGPRAMKSHLNAILEVKEIANIEWTPGSGCPPTFTPEYIPLYRKIQAAGKRLYLLAQPQEIEPLLNELSAKGLFLCTHASSEAEADDLLKKVQAWSKVR
ncbi:MAG: hypothetical protein WCQ21_08890 [Verrucomicrobiota bacterium]